MTQAVKSMLELAKQRHPPATYMVGIWQMSGENVPQDRAGGWSLIEKAADKNYGPALYEIAIRKIQGRDLPADPEGGLRTMREAATLGSVQAQYYLGGAYETGSGVPQELDRARRYFRLCAARGQPRCQAQLADLLLNDSNRSDDDYLLALAWHELADGAGVAEVRTILDREQPKLTTAQKKLVETWKMQLVRR